MRTNNEKPQDFKAILFFKPKVRKNPFKVPLMIIISKKLYHDDYHITGEKFQELVDNDEAYIETNCPELVCEALELPIDHPKIIYKENI
jgi:hypothetical protein